jgi:hypothetical protein
MAANASKLGLRAGGRLAVRGLASSDAGTVIGQLPEGVAIGDDGSEPGTADIVVLFASTIDEVHAEMASAHGLVADRGRVWVAYRKGAGSAALNRDTLQRALADHDLVGVSLVSLDGSWSAMRIRALRPGETVPSR